jgi:hypothetical protein
VNRLSAAPLMRSVPISLGAVFHELGGDMGVPNNAKVSQMFILPAYDATALAMLGFGILAAAALACGF